MRGNDIVNKAIRNKPRTKKKKVMTNILEKLNHTPLCPICSMYYKNPQTSVKDSRTYHTIESLLPYFSDQLLLCFNIRRRAGFPSK